MNAIEGIKARLWIILRQDATLASLAGGTPRVHHIWAPKDAPMPYSTYRVEQRPDNDAPGMASGTLWIDWWTYGASASQGEKLGARTEELLDMVLLDGIAGEAKGIRVQLVASGFMETDDERVHRWESEFALRWVRQDAVARIAGEVS